jgi:hypothetical protein
MSLMSIVFGQLQKKKKKKKNNNYISFVDI